MTIKLYQKRIHWYFSILGKEKPLGTNVDEILTLLDSEQKSKKIYIKCALSEYNSGPKIGYIRVHNYNSAFGYGYISSSIFIPIKGSNYIMFESELSNKMYRLDLLQIW